MLTRGLVMLAAMAAPAQAFEIDWPLACTLGEDCFIQQYMDHDAGPGVRDYSCGSATYDGHDGTDIRVKTLADMERGVDVLAAHGGIVLGVRDGEPDHLARTEEDRAAVANKECGNGVLLSHGEGWQTQYCHMKKGSLAVKKGEEVAPGQTLGQIGASGLAAFPHLHLTVRQGKKAADPFSGTAESDACGGPAGGDLWSTRAEHVLAYQPTAILGAGFAPGKIAIEDVESGAVQAAAPDAGSNGLVGWMWAINLKKGDVLSVKIFGPAGSIAETSETLERNKAQYLLFAGKKRKGAGWPGGEYVIEAAVMRGGKPIAAQSSRLTF